MSLRRRPSAPVLALFLVSPLACKQQQTSKLRETEPASEPAPAPAPGAPKGMYDDFEGGVWSVEACQRASKNVAGQRQSPIKIDPERFKREGAKAALAHEKATVTLIDNGHTIQANLPAPYVTGQKGKITLGGDTYALSQFHFHTRSEHKLKDGADAEMELHLVHKTADGKKAIALGYFIQKGSEDNEHLKPIWDVLKKAHDKRTASAATTTTTASTPTPTPSPSPTESEDETLWNDGFSLSGSEETLGTVEADIPGIISAGGGNGYYTYEGSLTTPPCAEVVTHMVSLKQLTASQAQLDLFRKFYAKNARPLQADGDEAVRKYRLIEE